MTFRSLYVEEYPNRETASAIYNPGHNGKTFCSLNAATWPVPPVIFARDKNLYVHYVDNCWCRIAVNAKDLREFLSFGVKTELGIPLLIAMLQDECCYVITEEEF